MRDRSPDPDADALWRRVAETVRPLKGRARTAALFSAIDAAPMPPAMRPEPVRRLSAKGIGETLDGGWDSRLRRGTVAPDFTIDLHGHTLTAAHAALEIGLSRALAGHARVLLLVTGRPPREGVERHDGRPMRGAIRAAVGDWLAHSPHAGAIAAVRGAHPRHGGAGALYVILRRPR